MDPQLAAMCEQCPAAVAYEDRKSCEETSDTVLHWVQDFPPLPRFSTPESLTMNEKWLICVGAGIISSVLLTEPFIIFLKTCFFVLILPCLKAILYILTCRCYLLFPPKQYEDELKYIPDSPEFDRKKSSTNRGRRGSLSRQRSGSNIGAQHMYWFFTGELSEQYADTYTPGPPGTQLASAAHVTPGGGRNEPNRLSKRLSKAEIDTESQRLANRDFKRMSQILSDSDLVDDETINQARKSKDLKKLSALMSKSQASLLQMESAEKRSSSSWKRDV